MNQEIKDIILSEISKKYGVSIETKVKNLRINSQGLAMLSLLGTDRKLWSEIQGMLLEKNLEKRVKNLPEALEYMRQFLGHIREDEKKEFGEVFTRFNGIGGVREQLSLLDSSFWEDENNKVLDCCCGIGNYYVVLLTKFFIGLKSKLPNETERLSHIVNNMLYSIELNPRNAEIFDKWIKILDPNLKPNIHCGDYLEFNSVEKWKINSWNLVATNPPYQKMDGGAKAPAKPIYNLFVEKAIKESEKVIMITPSRWFAGGKGLDNYRKMMLSRKDIKVIKHIDNASDVFGNGVEIKGGVSYFLIDKNHNGETEFNGSNINLNEFDVIVSNTESYSIIGKISKFPSINTICNPRSFFGISINDGRLSNTKLDNNYIKCFVSQFKGYEKWINIGDVKNKEGLKYYRVATPRAATKGGEGFGNLFIAKENECLSDSYISFFVNNESESESLLSYLKTKFANFLLSVRKVSQTVKGDTCKWIPLVPFDRKWSDAQLFEYFNLTEEEIKLIDPSYNDDCNDYDIRKVTESYIDYYVKIKNYSDDDIEELKKVTKYISNFGNIIHESINSIFFQKISIEKFFENAIKDLDKKIKNGSHGIDEEELKNIKNDYILCKKVFIDVFNNTRKKEVNIIYNNNKNEIRDIKIDRIL